MAKFKIVLKNGFSFDVEAENIRVTDSTITGGATNINYIGCTNGIPLYVNVGEIVAVIQEVVDDGE